MDRTNWRPLVDLFLPCLFAALPVEAIDHPTLMVFRWSGALASEVKALLRRLHFAVTNNCGDKNLVTPDDGLRPTRTRDFSFPGDILVCAPGDREISVSRDARRICASELRPIDLRERHWRNQHCCQ